MTLEDKLADIFRLDEKQKKALARISLLTIEDLLYYFPARYSSISEIKLIRDIALGETVTLYGKISEPKAKRAWKSKRPMGEAWLTDSSGKIKIMWFNQAYLAKMVHEGEQVEISGRVSDGSHGLYLSNPEIKEKGSLPIDSHDSLFSEQGTSHLFGFPVYPETRGITSKWIYHTIGKIIKSGLLQNFSDYIPEEILKKYNLPKLNTALVWVHAPKSENDAKAARKRFAFEEVFFIQLKKQKDKREFREQNSYTVSVDEKDIDQFIARFPFVATYGQRKAIGHITEDFKRPYPMARLLEGDVGSGKTAVAAVASYAIIKNRPPKSLAKLGPSQNSEGPSFAEKQTFGNLQVAYMAPTEILANQLFENFIRHFEHTDIQIGLITGSGCRKFPTKVASAREPWTTISRPQLLKWVENGEIPILIGTHALIQKTVKFKHLALVIIDEQHRFGTNQRGKLAKKESVSWRIAPHLLSMTATPIPRTLALTIYGDLDLTLLDEMPAGRKQVITEIVSPEKRGNAYQEIRRGLKEGRQLYVICPRINEPDPDKELALQTKSVTAESARLRKEVFPEYKIGILHSKMTKQKKEEVMKDFSDKKIDILVATSVVEVGVNVPNATMIIIEGAERFGLAQLHQLRGRVIRSTYQSYCYLFAEGKSGKTAERLKALKTAKNGFELSELDLALRGAGELGGGKQWGITDLGMEAIKNIKMVEAARTEATHLIEEDINLVSYPVLKTMLDKKHFETHFE